MPMPTARPKISRKASTKCMNEPAQSTRMRCQPGWWRNERGSSAGSSTSSSECIPMILTKPPTGSALMPYSVSPRLVDQMVGPKPTKYLVHFMPNFLASTKWPVSCSITEKSKATRKMTHPIRSIRSSFPSPYELCVQFPGPPAGPVVHGQHVRHGGDGRAGGVMLRDYPCHGVNNARKADPSRLEVRHARLVRRV